MQRFLENDCQAENNDMKGLIFAFLILLLFSCKKESTKWITGTIIQTGCYPGSWMVQIDNPDWTKEPFLCGPNPEVARICENTTVIVNLPASLSQPGTQIKFSQWTDKGLLCFSSTLAPHHLEVADVSAK